MLSLFDIDRLIVRFVENNGIKPKFLYYNPVNKKDIDSLKIKWDLLKIILIEDSKVETDIIFFTAKRIIE